MRQEKTLRVIQITDTHLSAINGSRIWGVDTDKSLTAVLEHLKHRHLPADFVLATGDLVQDEGREAYERLRNYLAPLAIPVYCLPGNHDIPDILDQVFHDGQVLHLRQVVRGAWQFVLLDSTVRGSTRGHLDDEELSFLEDALASHPDHHTMVCLHHQPLPVGSRWLDTMAVDNGAELFAIMNRHPQIRAVIWGHVHQEFADRRGAVELLATPSTCVQFRPGIAQPEADDRTPGYRWFNLGPDGTLETGVERVPR